jgi:hypothetical protein
MTSPVITRTPYEHRIDIIASTIRANSAVEGSAADDLAVQVLLALNSIPEKVR